MKFTLKAEDLHYVHSPELSEHNEISAHYNELIVKDG